MVNQDNLIHVQNLQYRFPKGEFLEFEDLKIKEKEHTLLLGNSGSGKTTFLHILCGLLRPDHGDVVIEGQSIYGLSSTELDHFRGKKIGIVFQNAHLIDSLNVFENLQLAQNLSGAKTNAQEIQQVLDQLGLREHNHKFPKQLSRGQVQRVAIGRALINHPAILIADEPTAALDDYHTKLAMELFFKQADQYGATLVVATHDQRIKELFTNTYHLKK